MRPVVDFDVARVRGLYPTAGAGVAHLDGPFSALQPESVIRAVISTLRSTPSQPGSRSDRSKHSARSVLDVRRAIADLVGARTDSVVLGHSAAGLLLRFATLLSGDWRLGDEIVLSRTDTDLGLRTWKRTAHATGGIVHVAEMDLETGELPLWQFEKFLGPRTRIVSVPITNPATGAVPDLRAIAELAHQVGALVIVDAGAAAPHVILDMADLGADLLLLSTQTFGGPTAAAMVIAPAAVGRLVADIRLPVPQRFEFGPLPIELLAGVSAAIDHLAGLDEQAFGSRRERIVASLTASGLYQREVYRYLDEGLRSLKAITVLGSPGDRLPMAAFTVAHRTPDQVGDFLYDRGISVWTGPSGVSELMSAFGADELGGATFVGLMPHSTIDEVHRLVDALSELSRR